MAVIHPLMDVSWDDWRVVHAAWAHGSFTAAATALGLGQATVSRRVAAVEAALGQPLFDRHRAGLVPTPAAERMRPHLEALATAADGAARAVAGLEGAPRGEVRVAGPPGLCVDWMPRLAARVAAAHPEVTLCVLADIEPRDLDRREADVALRMMPTDRGDLLSRRLLTLRGGLYAAPAYRDRLPAGAGLSDLRVVHYSDEFAHIPMARALAGLGGRTALRSNDYLVLRAAVQAGLGAGLFGHAEARALGLAPLAIPLPFDPVTALYVVVHRALRQVPRVAVVIDAIDALVAELGEAADEAPITRTRPRTTR
jgi:DNA-binding transcriptional LysR family regulator